jgi:hypothetical protein
MDKAHIVFVFSASMFLLDGCCREKSSSEKQFRHPNKSLTEADFFNNELATKYNYSYYVLTDSVTTIYSTSLTPVKTVARGTTFYHQFKRTTLEGYMDIMIEGKPYVISREAGYFPQEYKGMKYPLFGITSTDSQFAVFRNAAGQTDTVHLEKGTPYLYVLRKDENYINFWDEQTNTFQTVAFCCDVEIIQAEDHRKLIPDYTTNLQHIH